VVGSGFDIKGRGVLQAGMPEADLKGEDIEAATRNASVGSLSMRVKFNCDEK